MTRIARIDRFSIGLMALICCGIGIHLSSTNCLAQQLGAVSDSDAGTTRIAFERIQLSDKFYSEGGTHGDFNADGKGDVAVGPWIYWGNEFEEKSRFYEGDALDPVRYSENFLMFSDDVNGDQLKDILVIGFPGLESWWFENPGKSYDQLWRRHTILDVVDNESPLIADIDGDGVTDLICSSRGHYGFASHAGRDPTQPWGFHHISPDNKYQRYTHGLGIGDVDNDRDMDLLEKDGWWENPASTTVALTDTTSDAYWDFHPFAFSSGGSQMYALDLDGDGRNEVLTGLAGHGYGLVYYKASNDSSTDFQRFDIMTGEAATSPAGMAVSQLHAVAIGDINADGVPDILTGKRWWAHANKDDGNSQPATLLWLQTQRQGSRLQFVPHVIDNSSGVGCQITLADVNGDGLLDVVSGIKRGAYVFLQRPAGLSSEKSLVPGLAADDPFGQRPAMGLVAIKDSLGGFRPATSSGRELNFSFESGDLTDWEVRGPMAEGILAKSDSASVGGMYIVDTSAGSSVKAIGELISRPFVLSDAASYLVGGGHGGEARVEIVSERSAAVLHTTAGQSSRNDDSLARVDFDSSLWKGELVRIRVIDHSEEAGVRFDDFRLHAR